MINVHGNQDVAGGFIEKHAESWQPFHPSFMPREGTTSLRNNFLEKNTKIMFNFQTMK